MNSWVLKNADGEWVRTDSAMTCPECNGAGEFDVQHPSGHPALVTGRKCGRCGGEGEVVDEPEDAA